MPRSAAPATRVRDPEGTKRKILAAALQEFSAKGIDGARVDAIAARARVNKQLLYYYFDSKDGLFRAVLRERLADRAPDAALADRTGPERLAALQDRLSAEPDWIRLLTWEALERSGRGPVER
jgi:TetR/AcrR family transcriptional regulator